MRLYRGRITKRFVKKYLGKKLWEKLLWAATLKVGDVVHTCAGYNKKIVKIEFEYTDHIRGRAMNGRTLIVEGDLMFEDGSYCSITHCVSPAWTKEQIIQANEFWFTREGSWLLERPTPIMVAIRERPDETLNDDGTLKEGVPRK